MMDLCKALLRGCISPKKYGLCTLFCLRWAYSAFGNAIGSKRYLRSCFRDICSILQKHPRAWKYIALTKYGHPRHPLYLSEKLKFQPFDIETYLESLGK